MNAAELVIPPPYPKIIDYPGLIGIGAAILLTCVLLVIVDRFDTTGGALAISLLIVLAFLGVVIFCMFFTVPHDETTAAVVGGLTAAFGAVIAHWIGKNGAR